MGYRCIAINFFSLPCDFHRSNRAFANSRCYLQIRWNLWKVESGDWDEWEMIKFIGSIGLRFGIRKERNATRLYAACKSNRWRHESHRRWTRVRSAYLFNAQKAEFREVHVPIISVWSGSIAESRFYRRTIPAVCLDGRSMICARSTRRRYVSRLQREREREEKERKWRWRWRGRSINEDTSSEESERSRWYKYQCDSV